MRKHLVFLVKFFDRTYRDWIPTSRIVADLNLEFATSIEGLPLLPTMAWARKWWGGLEGSWALGKLRTAKNSNSQK